MKANVNVLSETSKTRSLTRSHKPFAICQNNTQARYLVLETRMRKLLLHCCVSSSRRSVLTKFWLVSVAEEAADRVGVAVVAAGVRVVHRLVAGESHLDCQTLPMDSTRDVMDTSTPITPAVLDYHLSKADALLAAEAVDREVVGVAEAGEPPPLLLDQPPAQVVVFLASVEVYYRPPRRLRHHRALRVTKTGEKVREKVRMKDRSICSGGKNPANQNSIR